MCLWKNTYYYFILFNTHSDLIFISRVVTTKNNVRLCVIVILQEVILSVGFFFN